MKLEKYSQKLLAINANWTAIVPRDGWRHFRIGARRYTDKLLMLEMMGVCDRDIRFWIPAHELRERKLWQPGWIVLDCSAAI